MVNIETDDLLDRTARTRGPIDRSAVAENINVIFIAGAGRSGSTLLGRVLGMAHDAKNFNELRPIWKKGFLDNQKCSCGARFSECVFWKPVYDEISNRTAMSPKDIYDLHRKVDRMKFFFVHYFNIPYLASQKSRYLEILSVLYNSLADHSNSRVLVDSSKMPTRALILSNCNNIRLAVVHLIRHPAGVAFSGKNRKLDPGSGNLMPRRGIVRSCLKWAYINITAMMLATRCSTIYLEYEHFCQSPQEALDFLKSQITCIGALDISEVSKGRVSLPVDHSFSGNPNRFVSGETIIAQDNRWKAGLSWFEKLLILVSCMPVYYFIRKRARRQRGYFGFGGL